LVYVNGRVTQTALYHHRGCVCACLGQLSLLLSVGLVCLCRQRSKPTFSYRRSKYLRCRLI